MDNVVEALATLQRGQNSAAEKLRSIDKKVTAIESSSAVLNQVVKRHATVLDGTGAQGGLIADVRTLKNGKGDGNSVNWYQTQLAGVIRQALYLVILIVGLAGAYLFGRGPTTPATDSHQHKTSSVGSNT